MKKFDMKEVYSKLIKNKQVKELFDKNNITADYLENRRQRRVSSGGKIDYLGLVTSLADKVYSTISFTDINKHDLTSEAIVAYIEAVNRYYSDPETYITQFKSVNGGSLDLHIGPWIMKGISNSHISPEDGRIAKVIKGAIYNFLRKDDILSPYTRSVVKKITDFIRKSEQVDNKSPSIEDIAAHVDLSVEKAKHYVKLSRIRVVNDGFDGSIDYFSGDDFGKQTGSGSGKLDVADSPEHIVIKADSLKRIAKEISKHPNKKERFMVELYFFEGLSLSEVAKVLNEKEEVVNRTIHDIAEKHRDLIRGALVGESWRRNDQKLKWILN